MISTKKQLAALAGAILVAPSASALEEFYTIPGTRAMGMAGAFAPFAADSSNIWYNPAGLGFQSQGATDFTVDYGSVVVGRENAEDNMDGTFDFFDTEEELRYVGVSSHGFGLAYFRPYNYNTFATSEDTGETAFIQTEYEEIKFGFGSAPISLNNLMGEGSELSLGGTIDLINRSPEVIRTSCTDTFCAEAEDTTGFGVTAGALLKKVIHQDSQTKLNFSAVYRSSQFGEDEIAIDKFDNLPGRPESIGVGAALQGPLTFLMTDQWGFFGTLTVQYDDKEFEDVVHQGSFEPLTTDQTRLAFGSELQVVTPSPVALFIRIGKYDTEQDGDTLTVGGDSDFRPYSEGVEATTFGFGLRFGTNFVLDYAREDRTILETDFTDDRDEDETLDSLSVSFIF